LIGFDYWVISLVEEVEEG